MSEEALIRRENLKRLIETGKTSIEGLMRDVGGGYSYWQGLVNGSRSFGERKAREIEDKLRLTRFSLDMDAGMPPRPRSIDELRPREVQLLMLHRQLVDHSGGDIDLGGLIELLELLVSTPKDRLAASLAGAIGGATIAAQLPAEPTDPTDPRPVASAAGAHAPKTAHRNGKGTGQPSHHGSKRSRKR